MVTEKKSYGTTQDKSNDGRDQNKTKAPEVKDRNKAAEENARKSNSSSVGEKKPSGIGSKFDSDIQREQF